MASSEKTTDRPDGGQKLSAPSISLPKGGGAIRGMGEKFAANPVTGTGSMTVPIAVSPGRSGFGPQLSLSYDSGSGNGPFGFGWSLSLPSITRKTDKGLPRYFDAEESDEFILSGAEDLVPVLVEKDGKWERESVDPRTVDGKVYTIQRFRPRIEGLFARIERWTNKNDPTDVFWRSISKDNITTWYGKTANSRIFDSAKPSYVFSWLICKSYDDKGNAIIYEYAEENSLRIFEDQNGNSRSLAHERNRNDLSRSANRYLKRIKYGNLKPNRDANWKATDPALLTDWMFEVVLDYEEGHYNELPLDTTKSEAEQHRYIQASVDGKKDNTGKPLWVVRVDPFSTYKATFEIRTYRLCQRILMFHHFPNELGTMDYLVRSTEFTYSYENDPTNAKNPIYSFLDSVSQSGYVRQADGKYLKKSLPPLQFFYTQPVVGDTIENVDFESLENLPAGLDGSIYQWTDLHGEGISGILTEQADAWYYKRNLSPISKNPVEFAPMERVIAKPNTTLAGGHAQFMDLAGDGQPDVVVMDGPMPGLYEHDEEEGWKNFQPYTSRLNRDMRDPNLKLVDLDGDGHADVLITEDNAFVWHPSLSEEGFGPALRVAQELDEEKGPRLVFADGTQSIYLADLSGDGLSDLARIRNGEVCYWPNLGYGKFGTKVTMDNAPWFDNPDQFDQKRIRLADIDGSGTTDIIYLHRDGIRLYFNQSGNSWSAPQILQAFSKIDEMSAINPMDLKGNGTACLVWSSPLPGDAQAPMKYVDLMKEGKPHLLARTVNNLGAETKVHYAPSTKFYLKDRQEGRPWITRLPFPVHVVERVETYDYISRNRFVTRYAYHHGYFDGVEREFRGFGMVEQWDTEEFAALSKSDVFPTGDNVDQKSHVPPVLTKTWFHTGAYFRGEEISRQLAHEYYGAPKEGDPEFNVKWTEFEKALLPDTVVPPNLTLEEEREACRSLKGSMLRQEVYALDKSEKEKHPYTVTEQNFTIRMLQPMGDNQHAVFFTHPREAISFHYERNPADLRIGHQLTLEVDEFGNVLKSASIGYGRRKKIFVIDDQGTPVETPNPELDKLDPDDQKKQTTKLITFSENRFTNAIDEKDEFRTPLICEARTYELTGYDLSANAVRFSMTDFVNVDPWDPAGKKLILIFDNEINYEDEATSGRQRRLIEHVRNIYRKNDLTGLLELGALESLALAGEIYKLAFTPGLLDNVYKRKKSDGSRENLLPMPRDLLADEGGYRSSESLRTEGIFPQDNTELLWTKSDEDGHWWIPSGKVYYHTDADIADPSVSAAQELVQAKQHFFLARKFADPFGNCTKVDFDATYDLLVSKTLDALDNEVKAVNDYRVLQPKEVIDANENQTEAAFDALGMLAGTAIKGKVAADGKIESGDSLAGFTVDLTQSEIDAFFAAPKSEAAKLLKKATTRIIYDVHAYFLTKDPNLPAYAATLAREKHGRDVADGDTSPIQVSFSYSDGFGREIQKKIQAEPGKVEVEDNAGSVTKVDTTPEIRWVGSGWTIFNNKGKPVRKYEPFFSMDHSFQFGKKVGVSPILFYDPVERVIATLHPNHTYEKVVFDPWKQATWDVNDTVTLDPRTDPDVKGFFVKPDGSARLPEEDFLPTWHALRMDAAHAAEANLLWPDADIREAEKQAAQKAVVHEKTPAIAHFDSLGRVFLSIAHNRFERKKPDDTIETVEENYSTRFILDIEGNQRAVLDERKKPDHTPEQRMVMQYDYYMAGPDQSEENKNANLIHQSSMEAGERWILNDVTGKPIRNWDGRGHNFNTAYDELRRPLSRNVRGTDIRYSDSRVLNRDVLFEKIEYGEGKPDNAHDTELNMRTRVFQQYDGVGMITNMGKNPISGNDEGYDCKGNLLRSQRVLVKDYKNPPDWKSNPKCDDELFMQATRYDALNRPVQIIAPYSSNAGTKKNIVRPVYNEANLLDMVYAWLEQPSEPGAVMDANTTPPTQKFVKNIDYNAKGQRELIEYGNGVKTSYAYDKLTFGLIRMRTVRGNKAAEDCTPVLNPRTCEDPPATCRLLAASACIVQDLCYTYDPAGNITHIRDDAQQTVYFRNQCVEPSADYIYDAVYRLIHAAGREHAGQGANNLPEHRPEWKPHYDFNDSTRTGLVHPNDGQAMRTYQEEYQYDEVGNFIKFHHDANGGTWTRYYEYSEPSLLEPLTKNSNRLSKTSLPGDGPNGPYSAKYKYDMHGSMTSMPHLPLMRWDYRDQLQASAKQVRSDGGTPETTYYVYDSAGQRVRKVTDCQAAPGEAPAIKEERIYLGGFEIYRRHGADPLTRETIHIMDDKQRIALVETRTQGNEPGVPRQFIRYQFGNHLGSASLELDDQAQIISYEEYFPYGSTSYQSVRKDIEVPAKRYRYTGKEHDEESGLHYYGARYYGSWLGRWTSCDPAGFVDRINLYLFCRGNSLIYTDYLGLQSTENQDVPNNDLDLSCKAIIIDYDKLTDDEAILNILQNKDVFEQIYADALNGNQLAANVFERIGEYIIQLGFENAESIFVSDVFSKIPLFNRFYKDKHEYVKETLGSGPGATVLYDLFCKSVISGLSNPKSDKLELLGDILTMFAFATANKTIEPKTTIKKPSTPSPVPFRSKNPLPENLGTPKYVGSVEPVPYETPGTGPYGDTIQARIVDKLKLENPDVKLSGTGQYEKGIDIKVDQGELRFTQNKNIEVKPYSKSGFDKFCKQLDAWKKQGINPQDVDLLAYDKLGNLFLFASSMVCP